jgi:hypothetical protein
MLGSQQCRTRLVVRPEEAFDVPPGTLREKGEAFVSGLDMLSDGLSVRNESPQRLPGGAAADAEQATRLGRAKHVMVDMHLGCRVAA